MFAPIRLNPQADGSLLVRNRYAFRDTSHVRFAWTMHRGDDALADGTLDLHLDAGASTVIRPPVDLTIPEAGDAPVWWTVRAVQDNPHGIERSWMSAPYTIAIGQLLLRTRAALPSPTGNVEVGDHGYRVGGATLDLRGELTSLFGRRVAEMRVDAWRAPTDNDRRAGMWTGPSDMQVWRAAGLHLLTDRRDHVERTPAGGVAVRVRTAGPATDCGFRTRYTWTPVDDGDSVDLRIEIEPEGRWPASVARLGILLVLEEPRAQDATIRWHGLGPDESYADSKAAAVGGAYAHTVTDWQTTYTHPQENGARRGVTMAEIGFHDGSGLILDAADVAVGGAPQDGITLSLRPWSDQQLETAAHPIELRPDGRLHIHLDAAIHGLGSAACGPGVLPNAQLHAAPVHMHLRLRSA